MKTPFECSTLGSLTEVDSKSQEMRFIVTLIRAGDANGISTETISAAGLSVAFISARHIFPDAQILSVALALGPSPRLSRVPKDHKRPPSARFINGTFRPVLFNDEFDLCNLND